MRPKWQRENDGGEGDIESHIRTKVEDLMKGNKELGRKEIKNYAEWNKELGRKHP